MSKIDQQLNLRPQGRPFTYEPDLMEQNWQKDILGTQEPYSNITSAGCVLKCDTIHPFNRSKRLDCKTKCYEQTAEAREEKSDALSQMDDELSVGNQSGSGSVQAPQAGMGTGAKIAVGVGGVAVVGTLFWLLLKK